LRGDLSPWQSVLIKQFDFYKNLKVLFIFFFFSQSPTKEKENVTKRKRKNGSALFLVTSGVLNSTSLLSNNSLTLKQVFRNNVSLSTRYESFSGLLRRYTPRNDELKNLTANNTVQQQNYQKAKE